MKDEHLKLADPSPGDTPIDFRPLRHAVIVSAIVKTVNYTALAALISGAAYLLGYGNGREAGAYLSGEQFKQQLQQLEKQLQHKKENNHIEKERGAS